jgi:hypothetical protein
MSDKTEIDHFAEELRNVTRSLDKKRFWSLVREEIAALGGDRAKRQMVMRTAADEVARLSEPSARIELNGHSASSLLRAIAEAAEVDPPAFGGVEGRGPDNSVIAISPFEPSEALYAFAVRRRGEETTFVDGYFYRTASELLERLSQKHGPGSPCCQQMAKFVADAERAANDMSLPPLADAILARAKRGAAA